MGTFDKNADFSQRNDCSMSPLAQPSTCLFDTMKLKVQCITQYNFCGATLTLKPLKKSNDM